MRAAMTEDDIKRIEEGGTEPAVPLLRRLAAALNATVHLTPGYDLSSVSFQPSPPEHAQPAGRPRFHRCSGTRRYDRQPGRRDAW